MYNIINYTLKHDITHLSSKMTTFHATGQLSYRKISGSNQPNPRPILIFKIFLTLYNIIISGQNIFFRISNIPAPWPCLHAQLRGRTVIKKLSTFFGPWGRDSSQSPTCWIFRVKQIDLHPSTASERKTRQTVIVID